MLVDDLTQHAAAVVRVADVPSCTVIFRPGWSAVMLAWNFSALSRPRQSPGHIRALPGQLTADGGADPAGAAGDQGHPVADRARSAAFACPVSSGWFTIVMS